MGGGKVSITISFIVLLITGLSISGCLEKTSIDDIDTGPISSKDNLTIHFLDVGQGDSILVQFGNKNVLIDGGEAEMGSRIVSYLKGHGVSKLDLVVATHPHSDHIGGLSTILRTFPVMQVLDSGQVHSTQTYEDFLTLVDQKDIPYKVAEKGQKINIDPNLKIDVLNPPAKRFDDINDNSVILSVTYGQISFLLMGDAEREAETNLLSTDLDSDILKVGHHGSTSSSSSAFLKAVSPEISIIEVGKGNDYGHPSSMTLKALKDVGSKVYRTDLNGNIIVATDGTNYAVAVQKGSAAPRASGQIPITSVTPTATSSLSISAVQFDAPGDDRQNLNGEWIKVANPGPSPVIMSGWMVYDDSGQVYKFPEFALGSGATVTIYTGDGRDSATNLYMGSGSPIWNNNGDTAILMDASGNVVSQRSG